MVYYYDLREENINGKFKQMTENDIKNYRGVYLYPIYNIICYVQDYQYFVYT